MKVNELRRAINEYSRETSAHPYTDYGDKVTVRVNDDCPVQECRVTTQYEDRDKKSVSRPYRGWNLAPRKYFSLDDIDEWDFKLRLPDDFIDKKTVVNVDGSAYVKECSSCNGSGKVACSSCLGKGKTLCKRCNGDYSHLSCSHCGGSGHNSCPSCGGKGEHVCSKCKGTGRTVENVSVWKNHWDYNLKKYVGGYEWESKEMTCSACGGKGRWRCNNCGGTGHLECRYCDGRGYVTCPDCNKGYVTCEICRGDGKITCRVCEGAGKNEFSYVVDRSLSKDTRKTYVCDKRVRGFVEEYELDYPDIQFRERRDHLGEDLFTEDVRCSSSLSKLVSRSEPDSGVILFQEALVRRVMVTYVEYELDGSSYTGYVCNGVFYPENSPIDEWAAGVIDNAEKKIRRGSSATSLSILDSAEQAGGDKKMIANLRALARKKLGNLQDAGVSVGFWLTILFLSPVLFNFYSKFNPVAPWAIVTNNPNWRFLNFLPLCQTLIFLGIAVVLRFIFSSIASDGARKNYSSIWIYFAKGFVGYMLAAVASMAVLVLLNYLGLSILTTFILGLILIVVIGVIAIAHLIIKWIVQLIAGLF